MCYWTSCLTASTIFGTFIYIHTTGSISLSKRKQAMKIVIRAPIDDTVNTITSTRKVAQSFLMFMLQFESMQRQYTCSITIRQNFNKPSNISLMLKVMLFFLSLWCVNEKHEERRGRWVRGKGNEMWGNRGNVSGMEVKGGLFSGLPVHLGTTTQWQQSERVEETCRWLHVCVHKSLQSNPVSFSGTRLTCSCLYLLFIRTLKLRHLSRLVCEDMLQAHSLIWHFIHIQISSLIYTSFSSTSVINGSFCKASVCLLGSKQCKSRREMFPDGSLTMAPRECRWQKQKDMRWLITPSSFNCCNPNVNHVHLYSPFQVT